VLLRVRALPSLLTLGLAALGCGSGTASPDAADATGSAEVPDATGKTDVVDAAEAAGVDTADARDVRYSADGGPCTPGVPRCHGDFGYQMCEQDGTFGASHTCAGYSSNGTSSYCAEIPMDTGDAWATCVDPACWYWIAHGLLSSSTPVGICLPDGTINQCSRGGTLSVATCDGVCTQVGTLDGRALGFCAPVCQDGARECLGGAFYRTCVGGHWDGTPRTCTGACNPLVGGARPDIRCGGACDPGTSRCQTDLGAVELCTPAGTWALDRACLLGRCRPAGPQAECQAECAPGQHQCAFDGAAADRRCDDGGRWTAETACTAGTSCRLSGDVALGCVACVGARTGGGNAFSAADSRCAPAGGTEECGADNLWHPKADCPDGNVCAAISRGASSLAACQAL
jgi:hypothetical protein